MRKHLTETAAAAMEHCGDYLVMLEDETREHRKLDVGFFCQQRLCSGCAWRAAVRDAQCIAAISGALTDEGRIMIMATLTVPNVPASQLRATVQHLGRSWTRLLKRQRYACWADSVRKIEITYNRTTDTYHPHIHAIVYAPPGYLSGRQYVSQARLLDDWRQVTGQPEITQVDIRRCRDLPGRSSAVLEVAKYAAKASDYAQREDVLDAYYAALHKTHIMTYAGRCKQLRKDYLAGHLAKYEQLDTTRYVWRVVYIWQRIADADPDYVEHDVQPYDMDAAEIARLQRDEQRLADYAIQRAERADGWAEWARTDWARRIDAELDETDWSTVEVMTEP